MPIYHALGGPDDTCLTHGDSAGRPLLAGAQEREELAIMEAEGHAQ